jgi:septal ring factor EnvC (AmiA/AmiB activator)
MIIMAPEPINVQKNIDRINKNIADLKDNIKQMKDQEKTLEEEILRLEGCLITFRGFKTVGLIEIKIPEDADERPKIDQEELSTEFCDEIRSLR